MLKKLREENNYTEEYVAYRMQMSQSAYSRLERGQTRLSIDKIQKLSQIYNKPVNEIIEEYQSEEG